MCVYPSYFPYLPILCMYMKSILFLYINWYGYSIFILSSCPTPYIFPFFLSISIATSRRLKMPNARPMAGAAMYICSFAPCRITTPPFTTMTLPTMTEKTWWSPTWWNRKLPVHRASAQRLYGDILKNCVVTGKWVGKKNCWMVDLFPSYPFL